MRGEPDVNTGLLLPQAFARYAPVVDNARLPGRAFVIVALMTSLLAAAAWREGWAGRRYAFALTLGLVLIDLWPAPLPVLHLDRPALDQTLRTLPEGVVLEVPFGVRDGFGEVGRANHRALYFQTIHEQPMAGGFVCAPRAADPGGLQHRRRLRALLALSAGEGNVVPASAGSRAGSLACTVRYLVIDAHAPAPAQRLALDAFDLEPIAASPPRTLYRVRHLRHIVCPTAETG